MLDYFYHTLNVNFYCFRHIDTQSNTIHPSIQKVPYESCLECNGFVSQSFRKKKDTSKGIVVESLL